MHKQPKFNNFFIYNIMVLRMQGIPFNCFFLICNMTKSVCAAQEDRSLYRLSYYRIGAAVMHFCCYNYVYLYW